MTEVFINDNRLDLVDKSVAQTFQINDIGNLDTRQTSYTNRFKVPKTPNNIRLFNGLSFIGKYHEVDLDSEQFPYGTPQARIVENGIELLSNGYAVASDSGSNYYSINIYGNEKTFFEKLKEYTLQDVFPETIITYSTAGIASNVLNDNLFIFTLLHYNEETKGMGSLEANQTNPGFPYLELYTERITPQFYAKDLFNNIFNFLGYSVVNPLTTNENFNNLLVSASKTVSSFDIDYGSEFDIKNVAPIMRLNKFLSEIMYRFGLLIKINERTKTVHFKNIDDLILNGGLVNWSNKFHGFKKEIYKLSNYAILNNFKYSNDVVQWSDFLGLANELQGSFNILNKNLGIEKTIINSDFSKPKYAKWKESNDYSWGRFFVHSSSGGEYNYWMLDMDEYKTDEDGSIESYTESFVPQLFYRTKLNFDFKYKFRLPDGNYETFTKNYAYLATYPEINFQDYIDNYYQEFIKLLNHTQVINAIINLNTIDIYNLDFFKKIYIKQLGGEFYLNKVKNYKAGKLTEVELVRIPTSTQSVYGVYGGYSETSQMIGTI